MYNKLKKQAYFIKRLRDSGYEVYRWYSGYSTMDKRSWTIMINPGSSSVFCTCHVNNEDVDGETSDTSFAFDDGGQFIPGRLVLNTNSIEVIIQRLMKFGIEPPETTPPPPRNGR